MIKKFAVTYFLIVGISLLALWVLDVGSEPVADDYFDPAFNEYLEITSSGSNTPISQDETIDVSNLETDEFVDSGIVRDTIHVGTPSTLVSTNEFIFLDAKTVEVEFDEYQKHYYEEYPTLTIGGCKSYGPTTIILGGCYECLIIEDHWECIRSGDE